MLKVDTTNSTSYPVDLQDIARCDYVRRCAVRASANGGVNGAGTLYLASSPVSCSYTYDVPKFFHMSADEYISQDSFATKGSCHSGGESNPDTFMYMNFGFLSDLAKGFNSVADTSFTGEVIYEMFAVGHGFSADTDS